LKGVTVCTLYELVLASGVPDVLPVAVSNNKPLGKEVLVRTKCVGELRHPVGLIGVIAMSMTTLNCAGLYAHDVGKGTDVSVTLFELGTLLVRESLHVSATAK
jgi:hypothetical protein